MQISLEVDARVCFYCTIRVFPHEMSQLLANSPVKLFPASTHITRMYSHYNTDGSNGSVIQGGCEGAEVRGFGVLGCGCGGLGRSGVVLGPYLNLQWGKRGGGGKRSFRSSNKL